MICAAVLVLCWFLEVGHGPRCPSMALAKHSEDEVIGAFSTRICRFFPIGIQLHRRVVSEGIWMSRDLEIAWNWVSSPFDISDKWKPAKKHRKKTGRPSQVINERSAEQSGKLAGKETNKQTISKKRWTQRNRQSNTNSWTKPRQQTFCARRHNPKIQTNLTDFEPTEGTNELTTNYNWVADSTEWLLVLLSHWLNPSN